MTGLALMSVHQSPRSKQVIFSLSSVTALVALMGVEGKCSDPHAACHRHRVCNGFDNMGVAGAQLSDGLHHRPGQAACANRDGVL